MDHHQDLCVIDPLNSIYPVLDRLKIQQILLALEDLKTGSRRAIRGPHYLKVLFLHLIMVSQYLSNIVFEKEKEQESNVFRKSEL